MLCCQKFPDGGGGNNVGGIECLSLLRSLVGFSVLTFLGCPCASMEGLSLHKCRSWLDRRVPGTRTLLCWAAGHLGTISPISPVSLFPFLLHICSMFFLFSARCIIIALVHKVENTAIPWCPPLNSYTKVLGSGLWDSHWSGMGLVAILVPVHLAGGEGPCWTHMAPGSSLWPRQEDRGQFQKWGLLIELDRHLPSR